MNPSEILRVVDAIHRDKNIPGEVVFEAIEAALISAAKKYYGEEAEIEISIDREHGTISGHCDGEVLDPEETVGRIGAQTAKQVIIQKIREAERDSLYDEFTEQLGEMVNGIVQRAEGGVTTVALGRVEALLPRSEQIPGESHHANERVRATICEVRKQGSRVKVILSRTRPQLVQRLFEQEIPEIADEVITIQAMSREPGYRSKVAVSSTDPRVDCVGACVGVRGNRIKNIVDELSGERIDIVRWEEDMQLLIPNALQPAEVDEVILCKMMGRAIVLVGEDQLSLAIGRRGQNVRLGSKLCGWDIEIMTQEELQSQIERAVEGFSSIEGVTEELADQLVGEGFLSYDDLSVIEPDIFMEMGSLTEEQVDVIVEQAEKRAEEAEVAAKEERRRQRELAAAEAKEAAAAEKEAKENEAASEEGAEGEGADSSGGDANSSEEDIEKPSESEQQESVAGEDDKDENSGESMEEESEGAATADGAPSTNEQTTEEVAETSVTPPSKEE